MDASSEVCIYFVGVKLGTAVARSLGGWFARFGVCLSAISSAIDLGQALR